MKKVMITDLESYLSVDNCSRDIEPGKWCSIDYKTSEFSGNMLLQVPGKVLLPIEIPLGVKGRYKIFIGYYHHMRLRFRMKLRLSTDAYYTIMGPEHIINPKQTEHLYINEKGDPKKLWGLLCESYWKEVDLLGDEVLIIEPYNNIGIEQNEYEGTLLVPRVASISHVRLDEVNQDCLTVSAKNEEETGATKRLAGIFAEGLLPDSEAINEETLVSELVQPLCCGDFDFFTFEGFRGVCQYPSKITDMPNDVFCGEKGIIKLLDKGINPIQVLSRHARGKGIKFFASIRVLQQREVPNHMQNSFCIKHPEFAIVDKEGRRSSHFSLAYKEVREYHLAIMEELIDYGADGISILFNRSFPFVLYDNPVVVEFLKKYDIDPFDINDDDIQWLKFKATYITLFLEEIRTMLIRKACEHERQYFLSIIVPNSVENCLYASIDVAEIISRQLIDYIIIHPLQCPGGKAVDNSPEAVGVCVREFIKLAAGNNCKVFADVYPRRMSAEAYAATAEMYYSFGVDGLSFWDAECRIPRISEWGMVKKLGHKKEIDLLKNEGKIYYRTIELLELSGYRMDGIFPPQTGG